MSISLTHSLSLGYGCYWRSQRSLVKLKAQSTRTRGEAGLDSKGVDEEHNNLVFVTQSKRIITFALCLTSSLKQLWQKLGQKVLHSFWIFNVSYPWDRSSDMRSSDEHTECLFVLHGLKWKCRFPRSALYIFYIFRCLWNRFFRTSRFV